jgi:hypothetical protein
MLEAGLEMLNEPHFFLFVSYGLCFFFIVTLDLNLVFMGGCL